MKQLLNKLIDDGESISKNSAKLNEKVDAGFKELWTRLNDFMIKYAVESTSLTKDMDSLIKNAKRDMKIWNVISGSMTVLIMLALYYIKK